MSKGCSFLAILVFGALGAVARADPAADEKAMVDAATKGDVATVARLLKAGVSADARDKDGLTALNWAAYDGHLDVVKALVAHKATVDADFNDMRWTPLMNAAAMGHLDVVTYLVAHKADVNALSKQNQSSLAEAAFGEHTDVAKFLLDHGADLEATAVDGRTPLFAAVEDVKDDTSLVKLLLARGAKTDVLDRDGDNLLEKAAASGNVEVAQILIARKLEVTGKTKGGYTPLEFAARTGKIKMIEYLLAHGADVDVANDAGQTPMMVAAAKGFPDAVAFLLDHGAKLEAADTGGFPALYYAIENKHTDVGKLLLARGEDPKDVFVDAVDRADTAAVKAYLDLGVGADLRESADGPTVLMFALSKTPISIPIVTILLDGGADATVVAPSLKTVQTPLMMAAFECNADAIRLLLAHGAARNAKTWGDHGDAYTIALSGATDSGHMCSDEVLALLQPFGSP